jgi:hypothetical protein
MWWANERRPMSNYPPSPRRIDYRQRRAQRDEADTASSLTSNHTTNVSRLVQEDDAPALTVDALLL